MNNGTFDFNTFIKESKDTLLNPKSYFAALKITGGLIDPLIKAVIYGLIAGVFAYLWNILNVRSITSMFFGDTGGVLMVFKYGFFSVVGLFIGAVIVLVISSICKGSTDFESNVRVTASIMVVLPILVFLGAIGSFSFYLGIVVVLIVFIFELWLLYNGLILALKARPDTSRIVVYVFLAIFIIMLIPGLQKMRETNKLLEKFKGIDFKELPKN